LKAVAILDLLSHNVHHSINHLSTFCVVALGPVVTSTTLSEDEVVGAEELAKGGASDSVDDTGFEINEDGTGNEFSCEEGASDTALHFGDLTHVTKDEGSKMNVPPFASLK
jgi:hypothetical protein